MADQLLMTTPQLLAALQGTVLYSHPNGFQGFTSVAIDSRKIQPGALFVALPGNQQDGHQYIDAAFSAGAAIVLMQADRVQTFKDNTILKAKATKGTIIVVENTLRALQDAAKSYLEQFPNLIKIGITGSSGKTTVKELTARIISQERSIIMNEGNLNSETGLPLSVFKVRQEHAVGVFEMGMNRQGEISELARVLSPHLALITNIGSAHIGILGSKDAIAQEKKAIFSQFSGKETALLPEMDSYVNYLKQDVAGKVVMYGPRSTVPFGGARSLGIEGFEILWDGQPVHLRLPGQHNVINAIAASAIALELGVSAESIRKGLASVKPLFGRSEILQGPVTIIQDCYNANPESAIAGIHSCDEIPWKGR
ncbi:MAG: UDP-N-acetylmuramoyl-tripeptide--D-alanyl-D-alanine ligase, partial [Termitinemataceae bacterium]